MEKLRFHRAATFAMILGILPGLAVFPGGARAAAVELQVAAAVSLAPALAEMLVLFGRDHPGIEIAVNAAASGRLRMQIEAGAPVDVFLSASSRQMDILATKGLLAAGSRRDILTNEIVLIAPAGSGNPFARMEDLAEPRIRRIALGTPRSVPAGRYAEELLRNLELWDPLSHKFVFAEHVRQVLDYVARGEVDAGFVYRTDAMSRAQTVRVAASAPPGSHGVITYPAAVVAGTRSPDAAATFLRFLGTHGARTVFRTHGFGLAGAAP